MSVADRWPVAAGLGGGVLAASWFAVRRPVVQRADVRAGDTIRRACPPVLDRVVCSTTDLGSMYAVAGIAATLAVTGRRKMAADVLAAGTATWLVAQGSKTGVRRERPYEADGVRRLIRPPTGSSFPSGHAAVGMAVLTVIGDRSPVRAAAPCLQAVGAYVALSRVYVGVHYPSDVIGGAGLGFALGALWRGPLAAAPGRVVGAALGGLAGGRRPLSCSRPPALPHQGQ